MHQTKDYYQLLDVSAEATAGEIKRAYRERVQGTHPDRNPGDPEAEERFKLLQEAYEVLSDPHRRRYYDLIRADALAVMLGSQSAMHGYPPGPGGTGSTRRGVSPPRTLTAQLTFDQSLAGGRVEIWLPGDRSMTVNYPKGVRDGARVRLPVQGKGRGPGDLRVVFKVTPSPRFRREADHLFVTEEISAIEAIVGTERALENAYGQTIRVQIPPGTQPGERLRVKGQGVQTHRGAGDLFVEVRVVVPRTLSETQREALRETARQHGIL